MTQRKLSTRVRFFPCTAISDASGVDSTSANVLPVLDIFISVDCSSFTVSFTKQKESCIFKTVNAPHARFHLRVLVVQVYFLAWIRLKNKFLLTLGFRREVVLSATQFGRDNVLSHPSIDCNQFSNIRLTNLGCQLATRYLLEP